MVSRAVKIVIPGGLLVGIMMGGYGIYKLCEQESKDIQERARRDLEKSNKPLVIEVLDWNSGIGLQGVPAKHIRKEGLVSQAEAYSNPTIKLGRDATIKGVRSDTGKPIGLTILDGLEGVTADSKLILMKKGCKLKFPRGNRYPRKTISGDLYVGEYVKETYFDKDTQSGSKYASRVEVLFDEEAGSDIYE